MADISVTRPHDLSLDEAKTKVEEVVTDLKDNSDYVDKIDWNADRTSADVKGKGFTGTFSVDESDVSVEIKLKLFAKPFKGKVREQVEARMDKIFG